MSGRTNTERSKHSKLLDHADSNFTAPGHTNYMRLAPIFDFQICAFSNPFLPEE